MVVVAVGEGFEGRRVGGKTGWREDKLKRRRAWGGCLGIGLRRD